MKIRRGNTAGLALPASNLKDLKDFNNLKDFTCGQSRPYRTPFRHSEGATATEESVCFFRHSEGATATEESVSE